GVGDAHALAQATDEGEHVSPPIVLGAQGEGNEVVHPLPGSEDRAEIERGGENADDGRGLPVDRDRMADDSWVRGESPLPEPMAEEHRLRTVLGALLRREQPAESRPYPEQREETLGHL